MPLKVYNALTKFGKGHHLAVAVLVPQAAGAAKLRMREIRVERRVSPHAGPLETEVPGYEDPKATEKFRSV